MKYVSGLYTDVGIKKKTNQDSLLLHHAETKYGEVVFAVVCDGMGGLQKGEVASAELVNRFSLWFKQSFPVLIAGGALDAEKLRQEWLEILHNCDDDVSRYGSH
ncbi:MAG: serine/threonine-protein phosphatase, partial [Clostridia bacterium]|nr:serine/threonine-protein phosphatase [Clostridia bacterium]